MKPFVVALIQVGWLGERASMKDQYQALVEQASKRGANLICLPEFSLSPYFASTTHSRGFDWAEPLHGGESEQFFGDLAQTYDVTVVGSLFEHAEDGRYFDTATIHDADGHMVYHMRKVHIPSGEGYHETSFFEGWNDYPVAELDMVKIATPTCYDQWFPETARICALNGAEFIYYPTAIGSEPTAPDFDSQSAWQTVMRGHAIANGVFIGAANRIGIENGISFYGSSFICDPGGNILAQAGRDSVEVVIAEIDPTIQTQLRTLFPLLHQRKPQTYQRLVEEYDQPPPERWRNHHAFEAPRDSA
jgi:N-carbamoylputrescine amidase